MRIFTILLAGVICATSVFAAERPVDRGSVQFEGAFQFTNGGGALYRRANDGTITANIGVAYFVRDGLAIGPHSALATIEYESPDEYILVGPSIAYFLNPAPTRTRVAGSYYPFVRAFYLWGRGHEVFFDSRSQLGGQVGLVLMATRHVGIVFQFELAHDRITNALTDRNLGPGGVVFDIREDQTGTSATVGIGLTGFLF